MAKTNKQRVHEVIVRMVFDKPCTANRATYEAKQCIHGEHYITGLDDGAPGLLTIRSVKRAPSPRQRVNKAS